MMDISRVPSALLSERLDAEFYRPEFLDNDHRLRQLGVCEPLSAAADDIQLGYTGPTEEYYCASESLGAYYLSSKNIVEGCVELTDGTDRVSLAAHNGPLRKTQVRAGDLLISRTGTVGKCALLFDAENEYNIAAHLIALRINGEFDSPFLGAFFNSVYGTRQSVRLQRGTIIHGLSVYDVPLMLVPKFSRDAQRYIGDKVRQAERLRELARRLEAESSAFFQLPEWTEPRAGTRCTYTARRGAMRSERLDAPFYDPGHEDLDALLRRRGDIGLNEVASLVEGRWTRGGDKFSYFEIGELDIASGVLSPTTTEVAAAPSRAQILVEPWDVLVSTVRPNRKNVGLVLPSDDSLALVASTGFAVLRFKNSETAAFYHSFLRSDAATQQLMRWNSGATYPAIESDVPLRVRAPRFDDEVVEREGRRWLTKFSVLSASRGLIVVATALVEHLLDGRLNEADLVAAQKALEAGDSRADREILKGLRPSDAPDAKALIADVDALHALLDGSEGQDA